MSLADWRRRVAEMYAGVRATDDAARAWQTFRESRDILFREHPQSPLSHEQRVSFDGLPYFPYDPAFRVVGIIERDVACDDVTLVLPDDGLVRLETVARARFALLETAARLNLFWIRGYGGGIFLPFRDSTASDTTYGGGRYLYDTIKGADLGIHELEIVLDFNYAYNPSCASNSSWACPLAPIENDLPFAVTAGEKNFVS